LLWMTFPIRSKIPIVSGSPILASKSTTRGRFDTPAADPAPGTAGARVYLFIR
jgi:hypothetical protein